MSCFGRLVLCSSGRSPYPRGARGLSRLIGMGYQAWERHRALLVRSLQAPSAPICWPRQETPLNGGQIPVNKTVSSAAGGTCKRGAFHDLCGWRFGFRDSYRRRHASASLLSLSPAILDFYKKMPSTRSAPKVMLVLKSWCSNDRESMHVE